MNAVISEMLRNLRKSRNLTQEQLGVLSGMTKSQISKMEKGTLGSEETVSRLLDALGYRVEFNVLNKYAGADSEKERVLDILRSFKKYNASKYGIESLALFGSFARGGQRPDSDVDILISLKSPSLYLYAEIADVLKSLLKRDVDLVPAKSRRSSEFDESISKDLIYV